MNQTLTTLKQGLIAHRMLIGYALTALFASASFFLPAHVFARWTAVALLILALPALAREFRSGWPCSWFSTRPKLTAVLSTYWPFVAVTLLTLVALGPISLGEMPVSQDHVNHYYATHILVHQMIPTGRLFGWTDDVQTGYPFGDLYHTMPYLLTGLLHLMSFGAIPLAQSYAFGIVLAWLVPALAVTAWTRRLAGPWASVVAGLLFVIDIGGDREGGWTYSMFHGVWAQQFGTGLWLFALLALWRWSEQATTRKMAAAVLLGGFALMAHPMNSIILLISFALMWTVRLFAGPVVEGDERRGAIRLIPAAALIGLVGLAWIVRMMLSSDVVYADPSTWGPLSSLMEQMLSGKLFQNELALVTPLAIVGAIQLMRQKGRFPIFALILAAALMLLGSMDLITGTDLGLLGGKIGVIQYRRFSIAIKPLYLAMAGVGFSTIGRGLFAAASKQQMNAYSMALNILLAVFVAPFVYEIAHALPTMITSPALSPLTLRRTGDAAQIDAISQVLRSEKKKNPQLRAVYWEKHGHGGLYPVLALADAEIPWHSTLKLPANNFKWQNPTASIETLARLGVSIVISKWKQDHPLLEAIGHYGRHFVYRIKNPAGGRFEIHGKGEAKILSFEPERRVIRVRGVDASTRLVLLMPPYRKWSAVQNGKPLKMLPLPEADLMLTEIAGLRDGNVIIEYRDSAIEIALNWIALCVIAMCIVGLIAGPRPLSVPFNSLNGRRIYQGLALSTALAAVLIALATTYLGRHAAERHWLRNEWPGLHLRAILHETGFKEATFYPEAYCVEPYTRDPHWGCTEADLRPALIPGSRQYGVVSSCLSVGVPPRGETRLTFDVPSRSTTITGRLKLISGTSVIGRILAQDDQGTQGMTIGKARREGMAFAYPLHTDPESLIFEFKNEGDQAAELCLEAVALGD